MSSENPSQNTGRRSSSKASRKSSKEPPDPTQIPLPSSPPASVQQEQPTPEDPPLQANGEKTKEKEEKKPTLNESLERILKEVARYDEDMIKAWRDDIDTVLIFAGLFSAAVTAFTIESYQWLDEDPADTTVTLLAQLISIQVNGSQSVSFEPTPFKPDPSSIRINVFWFLSLIFSLTSALFGLLCKQWIREYQRDTTTRTPGEALALRQLRRDSLEKSGVSSFLSALPILLEVALLFFFVGVLDLLWNRHPVPFAICFVAISFSAGLYFLTTLLPTLMVPRDQWVDIWERHFNRLSYQFICPYKSPQAWLVYRLFTALLRPLLKIRVINNFLFEKAERFWYHIDSPQSDWSSFDLWVVRQFDREVYRPSFSLKVYELRAFEWAVTMFRDSPSMIPHLRNVLETIPAFVAVSAVLGRWDMTLWDNLNISKVHVEVAFIYPYPLAQIPIPTIRPPVHLLFHHRYCELLAETDPQKLLEQLSDAKKHTDLQHSTGLRFVIPFSLVDALWTHEDTDVRRKSLKLLSLFEQSWRPCPGYDWLRHRLERLAFMRALADHINCTDRVSALLTSKRGQVFIRFIHNEAITRQLRVYYSLQYGDTWHQAIRRAQEVGHLRSDYFAPFPGLGDPLPALPTLEPVRYSIETERDVRVGNDEKLEIVTQSGMEDTSGAGPIEGSLIRHLHDFGAWLASHRRWLSFFQRDERVVCDNVGSSDNTVSDHESGGNPTDNREDRATALGDTSGQGDDDEENGGGLHSLNQGASDDQSNQERAEPDSAVTLTRNQT